MKKCLLMALTGTLLLSVGCGNQTEEPIATEYTGGLQTTTETEGTETGSVDDTTEAGDAETTETESTETETETEPEEETEETAYAEITSDGELKDYGGVVVLDNAAYELYSYEEGLAEDYAGAVNSAAEALDGSADVYNIVIPLSTGITFPDDRRDEINSSDEEASLNKIYAKMQENVHEVNIYDTLMKHRAEYLYFRTDHHWTALGAYYAYERFCAAKGIEPEAIEDYETVEYDDFIGSFYKDTEDEVLAENPDSILAYYPNCEHQMTVTPAEGDDFTWKTIGNVENSQSRFKYATFIGGDNPFSVIENYDVTDGSACIVVKESFGNAFVPFLIDHYQYIYVVDYRYWSGTLSELVKETGATDVIMINNLSMTRSKYLIGKLRSISK
jgi:hypothetical protein